jgi:hypothetical protein
MKCIISQQWNLLSLTTMKFIVCQNDEIYYLSQRNLLPLTTMKVIISHNNESYYLSQQWNLLMYVRNLLALNTLPCNKQFLINGLWFGKQGSSIQRASNCHLVSRYYFRKQRNYWETEAKICLATNIVQSEFNRSIYNSELWCHLEHVTVVLLPPKTSLPNHNEVKRKLMLHRRCLKRLHKPTTY